MPSRSTAKKTGLASLLSVLVAGTLLWLFAPTTLGGTFSYVVVSGNSMSPRLATGDLVLLRSASDYDVGDAVTYHHPQIGPILHRIVADDGERFTLSGDNREGNDGYQPTRADVIGREWIAIPNGGRVVRELQSQRNISLLLGATMLLGVAGGPSARGLRRVSGRARSNGNRRRRDFSFYSQSGRQTLIIGLGLAAGSVTLLAMYSVSGPTREDTERVPFVESGEFSYGGDLADGIYDGDRLAAPQPLFRLLSDDLPLAFDYAVTAPDAEVENVIGTAELVAVVGSEDGWTRTFPLEPVTRFASGQIEVASTLNLDTLEGELAAIAEQTGVASARYSLRIYGRVEASGLIDGLSFDTSFEQYAQFRLTELQLQFDGGPDSLVLTENRTVGRPITVDRVLDVPMLPLSLSYHQIPTVGAVGLGVAVVLLLLVAQATMTTRRRGEAARIRAAYGMLLVEVAQARAAFGPQPHDVNQFDDLVRLATAEGLAITHRSSVGDDEYLVAASDRSWRYAVAKPRMVGVASAGTLITTDEG